MRQEHVQKILNHDRIPAWDDQLVEVRRNAAAAEGEFMLRCFRQFVHPGHPPDRRQRELVIEYSPIRRDALLALPRYTHIDVKAQIFLVRWGDRNECNILGQR